MEYSQLPVSPLKQPAQFNFATNVVDYWAQKNPTQNALHWVSQDLSTSRQLTYQHFSTQSHRIAKLLTDLGLRQGEVCIIILPRLPQWWEIATACLRAGIIPCPCTTLLVDKDIEYRLQVSNAAAFIGDSTAVAKCMKIKDKCSNLRKIIQLEDSSSSTSETSGVVNFESALSSIPKDTKFETPSSLKPTSPGLIFFTSGTTGPPKIVLHTQTSYPLAHALTGVHWLRLTPTKDSIYWNLSEQGWAKAAWSFFATWNCGATLFVHDDRLAFNPKRTLEVLHKFPISTLCAPPTVYRQLVLDESRRIFKDPSGRPMSLRHACGAGEPLNESVIRTWQEMTGGMEICDGYGQTETILICANQAGGKVKPGSMGKPIPGVPLKIIGSNGEEVANDEEGDIAIEVKQLIKGEKGFFGFFEGYVKDMKTLQLDQRITNASNGKKYYITGDRATRDSEGYITFVGRNDDVINSSGYRIGKVTHFRHSFNLSFQFQPPIHRSQKLTSCKQYRSLRGRINIKVTPLCSRIRRRRLPRPLKRRNSKSLHCFDRCRRPKISQRVIIVVVVVVIFNKPNKRTTRFLQRKRRTL